MAHYKCDLQELSSTSSTHLTWACQWMSRTFQTSGIQFGTELDKCECSRKLRKIKEKSHLSEYDHIILYLGYQDFEPQDCEHQNAPGDILTFKLTFVVVNTMQQTLDPYPIVDCMQMFEVLGGSSFLPSKLSVDWRIWYKRQQNNPMINFMEIVR